MSCAFACLRKTACEFAIDRTSSSRIEALPTLVTVCRSPTQVRSGILNRLREPCLKEIMISLWLLMHNCLCAAQKPVQATPLSWPDPGNGAAGRHSPTVLAANEYRCLITGSGASGQPRKVVLGSSAAHVPDPPSSRPSLIARLNNRTNRNAPGTLSLGIGAPTSGALFVQPESIQL